jgi:hypothetical protein
MDSAIPRLPTLRRRLGFLWGNVYYYFKSKDEIGGAIVVLRISRFKYLLQDLSEASSPKECLCGFVDIKIRNRCRSLAFRIAEIWRCGCKKI